MAKAKHIYLSQEEKGVLKSWSQSGRTEQRLAERARMILALAEGQTNREVALRLRTRQARVSKWRTRFAQQGREGLKDVPRQGAPRRYNQQTERRILAVLDEAPPPGFSRWTGGLAAERLGDVSKHQVWRVLRRHGIHLQRRRRREFLTFMNEVVSAYSDQQIHVILDNLNTHKPKKDRWLPQHKKVHFHYTPTHASWLNQAEIWFSILTRSALQGASFTAPRQVREAIDRFVQAHNEKAGPFQWTNREVYQKG